MFRDEKEHQPEGSKRKEEPGTRRAAPVDEIERLKEKATQTEARIASLALSRNTRQMHRRTAREGLGTNRV